MAEILTANLEKIKGSNILETLGLRSGKYILLSAHREENIDSEANFLALMQAVNALAETYESAVPGTKKHKHTKKMREHGFCML